MWIQNEDRNVLVNADKIQILFIEPYFNGYWKIMADEIMIGSYAEKETCEKVFEGISKALREGRGFYTIREGFWGKKIEPALVSKD